MLQKKTFLAEALSSLTVNVTEEMQKAMHILSSVGDLRADDDSSEYENALERLADLVDNIDLANDFYKIGGFAIFQPCLNSSHSTIRWRIADIIAELAQNNPFCQDKLLEAGVFPVLLSMIDTDPSELARIKALYAVSCKLQYDAKLGFLDFYLILYFKHRYSQRTSGVVKIYGYKRRLLGAFASDAEPGRKAANKICIFALQFMQ